jgi:hypothetical protein
VLLISLVLWPALAAAQIPVLLVSPASLSFAVAGLDAPPAQQIRIRNTGSGSLQWKATPADPWVRVSPASGTGPAVVSVTLDAARLRAGRHESRVVVDAGDADDSPASIRIEVDVTGPAPGVAASAAAARPGAPPGASALPSPAEALPAPAAATAAAPPRPPASVSLHFLGETLPVATRNLPYSQAIPVAGGTPPYSIRLIQGRLPVGLMIANGAVAGTARVPGFYPLTLAITDSSRPPATLTGRLALRVIILLADTALMVSPPALALVLPRGARQTGARIGVGSGRQPLDWRASTDAAWLTLTPVSGRSPGSIEVGVLAGSLPPGAYSGTVTISMEGAPNSPARIPVTVTVPR